MLDSLSNSIAMIHERFQACIMTEIFCVTDKTNGLNSSDVSLFDFKALNRVIGARNELENTFALCSQEITLKAVSRALKDAGNAESSYINDFECDSLKTIEFITNLLFAEISAASGILRKMALRRKMLSMSGMSEHSARIRVRETFREELLKFRTVNRAGHKHKINWAIKLAAKDYLSDLNHSAYLYTASKLGYSKFEIYQPNHNRNGLKFDIDNIPSKELHPQSKALIKIVR